MATTVLLFPGIVPITPDHWMQIWADENPDFLLLYPIEETKNFLHEDWVEYLDDCIREQPEPPILVTHDTGCGAAAWWSNTFGLPLKAAMLVGPLDPRSPNFPPELGSFKMLPAEKLSFPSVLIGSRNDPFCGYEQAQALAETFGSQFIDGGHCGHFGADDGIGSWQMGKMILDQLISL